MSGPRVDDPRKGQYHGRIALRREIGDAVFVMTRPSEDAAENKSWHWHEQPFLWALLSGDASERVEGKDRLVQEPMNLHYLPGGRPHRHESGPRKPAGFGLIFKPHMADRLEPVGGLPGEPAVLRDASARRLLSTLLYEVANEDQSSDLVLEGLVLELSGLLIRQTFTSDVRPPRWLELARDMIRESSDSNLKMKDVAEEVGVHPVHLSAQFRRFYGSTPGEFLRSTRLEGAALLLRTTEASVAAIAAGCGYYDESHFVKAFRAQFGMTPSEYRLRL